MGQEWIDPTPDDSCRTCRHYRGRVFPDDGALPLPAHPRCQCFYMTNDLPGEPIDWSKEPDFAKQNYVYYTASLLRNNQPVPPVLEPLIPEAEAHNRQREEQNSMKSFKLNTYTPPARVDREKHIIYGVSLIQAGVEATGHNMMTDNKTIEQVVELARQRGDKGLKSRFTHPGLSSDGMGKFLGRLRNHREENGKAVADLFLSDLAAKSPNGDLRDYTEDLAEKEPDMFGMSIVFNGRKVWIKANGEELDARKHDRPADATTKLPLVRVDQLKASDLVDEPAANRDGLFSTAFSNTTSQIAEQAFTSIDYYTQQYNLKPTDLPQLLDAYYAHNFDAIPEDIQQYIDMLLAQTSYQPSEVYSFIHRYVLARQVRPFRAPAHIRSNTMPEEQVVEETAVAEASTTAPTPPATLANSSDAANGQAWLKQLQSATVETMLANSKLPQATQSRLRKGTYNSPTELQAAIDAARSELAALAEENAIDLPGRPPITSGMMQTGLDAAKTAVAWLFGVPDAPLPDPVLRNSAQIYRMLTGDVHWRGVFDRESGYALASANPTTLPGLAVDAMNKVIISIWDTLAVYRWFEMIVTVQPNDGSLHDMKWIQFGGLSNLSVVPDGAAYTEKTVADSKEEDSFIKHGNYVGVTRKMLRNSLIGQIQAVPKALAVAAIRTRSANIAAIFTDNSGVGPTLDQDSTALFHANHSNVATTAYSYAAWKAARLECYKQTELGSSKRQGLWPKFWLGPADLYDDALIDFGYGAGPGGKPATGNNDVNPYGESRPGDPRPVPVSVPEFTDTNDWAYLTDPALNPVIQVSYSQNPGGRTHPLPELFSVVSETAGLMFTNDTMPIKVRDEYAYGVATWRGIGKRNVT